METEHEGLKYCVTCEKWLPLDGFLPYDSVVECLGCGKIRNQQSYTAEPAPKPPRLKRQKQAPPTVTPAADYESELSTARQEKMAEIVARDSRTVEDLTDHIGVDRDCDFCRKCLPAEAYRTWYDTSCSECLRVKEQLLIGRRENTVLLHKHLTAHKIKHHVTVNGEELKHCSNCLQFLPLTKFYKNTRSNDGLDHRCKDCTLLEVTISRLRKRAAKLGIDVDF